mgnify:CR=1 FL=1
MSLLNPRGESEAILADLRQKMLSKRHPVSLEELVVELRGAHANAGCALGDWIGGEKGQAIADNFAVLGKLRGYEYKAAAKAKFRDTEIAIVSEIMGHVHEKTAEVAKARGDNSLRAFSREIKEYLEDVKKGHAPSEGYFHSLSEVVYDHLILRPLPKVRQSLVEDFHERLTVGLKEIFGQVAERRGLDASFPKFKR